jgi:quercetin dioxygenase-like cupin family protein
MRKVRITGNWRTATNLEYAGHPSVDANGHIERTIAMDEEAYLAIEKQIAQGHREGTIFLKDGRRFDYFYDSPPTTTPLPKEERSNASGFLAIDTTKLAWEERFSDHIGKAIYRKEFFSDPDTGMLVRLVKYPAGVINPAHTHPCGHGMYVLEGTLVTHKGSFGPGSFVWFPEGEVMEHGASADGDVVVVFITNKPFRIDYVGGK